ncbi:MAG: YetF domain-containing protein [Gemmatimonadales bacterium]
MDPVSPFDWHRMFVGSEPPMFFLEILFRVAAMYTFTVLAVRLMGKRGSGNLSPFESVVIIALGSAAGDTMFYPQVPLLYAFLVIAGVVALNRLFAVAQTKAESINAFLEGRPLILIKEGKLIPHALHLAQMRPDEVKGMLREQGIEDTGVVRFAFLERSGGLGVFRFSESETRSGETTFPADVQRD